MGREQQQRQQQQQQRQQRKPTPTGFALALSLRWHLDHFAFCHSKGQNRWSVAWSLRPSRSYLIGAAPPRAYAFRSCQLQQGCQCPTNPAMSPPRGDVSGRFWLPPASEVCASSKSHHPCCNTILQAVSLMGLMVRYPCPLQGPIIGQTDLSIVSRAINIAVKSRYLLICDIQILYLMIGCPMFTSFYKRIILVIYKKKICIFKPWSVIFPPRLWF